MFENIKQWMTEYEHIFEKAGTINLTPDEKAAVVYANFHLAVALMRDWPGTKNVARLIVACEEEDV